MGLTSSRRCDPIAILFSHISDRSYEEITDREIINPKSVQLVATYHRSLDTSVTNFRHTSLDSLVSFGSNSNSIFSSLLASVATDTQFLLISRLSRQSLRCSRIYLLFSLSLFLFSSTIPRGNPWNDDRGRATVVLSSA